MFFEYIYAKECFHFFNHVQYAQIHIICIYMYIYVEDIRKRFQFTFVNHKLLSYGFLTFWYT
jgi:hypothetical protein